MTSFLSKHIICFVNLHLFQILFGYIKIFLVLVKVYVGLGLALELDIELEIELDLELELDLALELDLGLELELELEPEIKMKIELDLKPVLKPELEQLFLCEPAPLIQIPFNDTSPHAHSVILSLCSVL